MDNTKGLLVNKLMHTNLHVLYKRKTKLRVRAQSCMERISLVLQYNKKQLHERKVPWHKLCF